MALVNANDQGDQGGVAPCVADLATRGAWGYAADLISSTAEPEAMPAPRRFEALRKSATIVVTGDAGCGKTAIHSALTGVEAEVRPSTERDEGYLRFSHGERRRQAAVVTIPGQTCQERRSLLDAMFGPMTRVEGVLHVVSNGFSTIWPKSRNAVRQSLETEDLASLRRRNLLYETNAFKEVVGRIVEKKTLHTDLGPDWLAIAVNKADLFWDTLADVEQRYSIHGNSEFSNELDLLTRQLGEASSISLAVFPMIASVDDYQFGPGFPALSSVSVLNGEGETVWRSVQALRDIIEGLIDEKI